ncbi:hypothetical protein [Rhizobium mesoamericanum]|uniref:hypothetical protein n=1 Tax=Rhizobium mesoamericanum TaxID=1079800 RepID=UPI0004107381|nr:hypothetical protein [Rhizobium mesoamericanum]
MTTFILIALLLILVAGVRYLLYAAVGYADYFLEERKKLAVLRDAIKRRRNIP